MKKLVLVAIILVTLSSCNYTARITDSEISAIRDQTDVLKEHNELVKQQNEILIKIEKKLK